MVMKYATDPKEIYTLEMQNLQRCFSHLADLCEAVSAPPRMGWQEVERARQFRFLLEEAIQVGTGLAFSNP